MWIEITVRTVECAKFQNGTNQTVIWKLWASWVVSFALNGCDCSNCRQCSCKTERIKLQFGCYEQAELCHLLWVDVTVPFIVRFVPEGEFTWNFCGLCLLTASSFLYRQIRSLKQIHLIFQKFFRGFAPFQHLSSFIVRFVPGGNLFYRFQKFSGASIH